MRLVVLCLLFVCAFARTHKGPVSLDDEKVLFEFSNKDLFDSFMALNERSYSSLAEQRHRFNIFTENLADIRAHNALGASHRLGLTTFADRTEDEFEALSSKHHVNVTTMSEEPIIPKSSRALKVVIDDNNVIQLAASSAGEAASPLLSAYKFFDWRYQHPAGRSIWVSGVTLVKNQGLFCGGCWAFAATGAMETYAWIKNGKSADGPPIYSQQVIIDCAGPYGGNGCGGGSPISGWTYAGEKGLLLESRYSFQGFQWYCDDAKANSGDTRIVNSWYTIQNKGADKIQKFLKLQPLTTTMAMGGLFLYKGGVYTGKPSSGSFVPSESNGFGCGIKYDHVVLIVAYYLGGSFNWMNVLAPSSSGDGASNVIPGTGGQICDPSLGQPRLLGCNPASDKNYWVIKNSYGAAYGEQGYSRFAMGGAKDGYVGRLVAGICGVTQKVMFPYYFPNMKGHINNGDRLYSEDRFEIATNAQEFGEYGSDYYMSDIYTQGGIAGALTAVNVVNTLNPKGVASAISDLYKYGAHDTMSNAGFLAQNTLDLAKYSTFAKGQSKSVIKDVLPMVGEYFNAGVYAATFGAPDILTFDNAQIILKTAHGIQKNYAQNSPGGSLYQPVTDKQIKTAKKYQDQMGGYLKRLVPAVGSGINIGLVNALMVVPQYSDYIVDAYNSIHAFEKANKNDVVMTTGDLLYATKIAPDVEYWQGQGMKIAQNVINDISRVTDRAPWKFPPKRDVSFGNVLSVVGLAQQLEERAAAAQAAKEAAAEAEAPSADSPPEVK